MSLASIKRKVVKGTLLKLVRHDWLKPLIVNGNLGQSVIKPGIAVGDIRPVVTVRSNAIAMKNARTGNDSWLYWPEAKNVRETPNGFEVDLAGFGEFKYIMGYEFVSLPFYVGRNDGTGEVFRFATLQEAEAKIAELETVYPVEVHNGEFYIDGPEELVQATKAA
jgi:hypothetical protein